MVHSFLLIGQSNMAGRGLANEVEPIVGDNLKVLRNGRWQPMCVPVNYDRAYAGICLAESFAQAYARDHGVTVGLIPCADGGTALYQWSKGGLLYDHAVMQAKLASRTSTITGVLWHQGESDCEPDRYATYAERFQIVMDDFRKDLDLYDVPFLLGGLGDYFEKSTYEDIKKYYPSINAQLKSVAATNKMTGYVPAEGLSCNDDMLHFDAKSLREFGLRYYQVFQTLEDPHKVFAEKPLADAAVRTYLETL